VVSQQLAESIDFETTLTRACELAVPEVADWCFIHLMNRDNRLELRSLRHADPAQQELLERTLRNHDYEETAAVGIQRVISSGTSLLVSSYSLSSLDQHLSSPETKAALRQLKLRSYMMVPLKARGQVLGTISLAQGYSGRNFQSADRPLVEDFGQRIALALDNAKLYSEAVHAVKDREDVLSVVSHDLKSPLTSIKLTAQLLERKLHNLPDAEPFMAAVGRIRNAVDSTALLIGKILDMGRIQAGTFSIEPVPITFSQVLSPLKDMFAPLAEEKGIDLHFEDPGMDYELICDPERITQVMSNLIGNAMKFTPDGGRVRVAWEWKEHGLLITVEDNGPGIPGSALAKLFDRYWQAKEMQSLGSGLGLYISKGIVSAHAGRIWAESEVGRGTKFSLYLPEAPPGVLRMHRAISHAEGVDSSKLAH
jgi:signal transduction histidine kinase